MSATADGTSFWNEPCTLHLTVDWQFADLIWRAKIGRWRLARPAAAFCERRAVIRSFKQVRDAPLAWKASLAFPHPEIRALGFEAFNLWHCRKQYKMGKCGKGTGSFGEWRCQTALLPAWAK
jgi:hypothetical protein